MATGHFPVKGSTITIGSDACQAKIVSDITTGGGKLAQTVLEAISGANYTCDGAQENFTLDFDMIVTDIKPFEYLYGAAVGDSVVLQNTTAVTNTISIASTNSLGDTMTFYFSGAQAMAGTPKFAKGSAMILPMSFSCTPDMTSVTIVEA